MDAHLILDELVSRIQTYVSLKAPTARNVQSFMDWIQDHKPLSQEESTFLAHKDDFVALSDGQECGWLDGVVEDTLNWCLPSNLMKVQLSIVLFYSLLNGSSKLFNSWPEILHLLRAVQKD